MLSKSVSIRAATRATRASIVARGSAIIARARALSRSLCGAFSRSAASASASFLLTIDTHSHQNTRDSPIGSTNRSDKCVALLARFYERGESALDWLRGGDFARLRLRLAQFVERLRGAQCTPVVFFDQSCSGAGEASWKRRQWRRVRDALGLVDALDASLLPDSVARTLRSSIGLATSGGGDDDHDDDHDAGALSDDERDDVLERARACRPSYLDAALQDICHALKIGVLHALDGTLRELSYYCRQEGDACRGVLADDPRLVLLPHVPRVFDARSLVLSRKAADVFHARTIERHTLAQRLALPQQFLPLLYLLTSAERTRAHVLEFHAALPSHDNDNNNNNNDDTTTTTTTTTNTTTTTTNDDDNSNDSGRQNAGGSLRLSSSPARHRHRRTFSSESDVVLHGLSSAASATEQQQQLLQQATAPYNAVCSLLRQHIGAIDIHDDDDDDDEHDDNTATPLAVLKRLLASDDSAARALAPHAPVLLADAWLAHDAADDNVDAYDELAAPVRSALTIDVSDSSDESSSNSATDAQAVVVADDGEAGAAAAAAAATANVPRSPSGMLRDLVNRRVEHGFDDVLRELVHSRTLHGQVLFSDPRRPPPSDASAPLRARIYATLFADADDEAGVCVRETHVVLSAALQPDETRATNGTALRRVLRRCVRTTTVAAQTPPLASPADRPPSFSAIGQYTQPERLAAMLNVVGLPVSTSALLCLSIHIGVIATNHTRSIGNIET
jgi:hypothetical protein